MKLKAVLFCLVILTGLFLSAFVSPGLEKTIPVQTTATAVAPVQSTAVIPAVTVVPATVIVIQNTPGAVPVTGANPATSIWTLVLFGLLALLGIAFLVALFSPRATREDLDRNPPPDL